MNFLKYLWWAITWNDKWYSCPLSYWDGKCRKCWKDTGWDVDGISIQHESCKLGK